MDVKITLCVCYERYIIFIQKNFKSQSFVHHKKVHKSKQKKNSYLYDEAHFGNNLKTKTLGNKLFENKTMLKTV